MIYVYNLRVETHNGPNSFYIGRGSVLGNPYTHIKDRKTKAIYEVKDRDEAIDRYSDYFDLMYGSNIAYTKAIDEIYDLYKKGEDVYLGCFCKKYQSNEYHNDEIRCHGDIIKRKLEQRLIKEKIKEKRDAMWSKSV